MDLSNIYYSDEVGITIIQTSPEHVEALQTALAKLPDLEKVVVVGSEDTTPSLGQLPPKMTVKLDSNTQAALMLSATAAKFNLGKYLSKERSTPYKANKTSRKAAKAARKARKKSTKNG